MLVVRVDRSLSGPHMVIYDQDGRFYARSPGGVYTTGACPELLGWSSPQRAGRFLRRLAARGVLRAEGEKRGQRYLLP